MFTTVARLCIVSIAVDVVVERQLLAGDDLSLGEDAHAQLAADDPFRDVAVWPARVIQETTETAFARGVDVLVRGSAQHRAGSAAETHLVLLQLHEVEVLDALVAIA